MVWNRERKEFDKLKKMELAKPKKIKKGLTHSARTLMMARI